MDSEQPISSTSQNDSTESVEVTKSAPRKRGRPAKKKVASPERAPEQPALLFSSEEDERARRKEDFVQEEQSRPVGSGEPVRHVTQDEPASVAKVEHVTAERERSDGAHGGEQQREASRNTSQPVGENTAHNHYGNRQHQHQRHDHGNRPQQQGPHNNGGNYNGGRPNHQQHQHQQGQGKKNKNKQFQGKKHRKGGHRPEQEGWSEPELPEQALALDWEALQRLSAAADRSRVLDLTTVYALDVQDLSRLAQAAGVTVSGGLNRRRIQRDWVKAAAEQGQSIRDIGLLEITEEGHGFLLYSHRNYRLSEESTLVPASLIRHYSLQTGHLLTGLIQAPQENSTCGTFYDLESVNGHAPDQVPTLTPFEELTPYYPTTRILLEMADCVPPWDSIAKRTIDLLTPIGLGQRGLIVAPPRTGKTVLLQNIAHSIRRNQPEAHLIILLVDERPEEVTDFRRQVKGAEIISSTFDENAESHVHAAEMVIEKARRMVEFGQHVIILLDSITRLARAYNTMMPSSGKILSGGVEANALQRPKRFFGSARNIEGGGSLTILGTALVETGSRMDEVIFEEFKGTGNMELQLDRALADKRIFPAISFEKSGTRKEELLYHPEEMAKIYSLRRAMKGVPSNEAMEMLIQRVKKTKTNAEFLMTINR